MELTQRHKQRQEDLGRTEKLSSRASFVESGASPPAKWLRDEAVRKPSGVLVEADPILEARLLLEEFEISTSELGITGKVESSDGLGHAQSFTQLWVSEPDVQYVSSFRGGGVVDVHV